MSQPPAKKQKTQSRPPIVFDTPGYQPDVRLTAFNQEYHVHSALLKANSVFFRKFLDSPEKATAAADNTKNADGSFVWMYDWVTSIDGEENQCWCLISRGATDQGCAISEFSGDVEYELTIFSILLAAIYNKPYHLPSLRALQSLVHMADYYFALPAVSRTLDAAIYKSGDFVAAIIRKPCKVLAIATKVRSALLFRESLIYCMGPWTNPSYEDLECPKLRTIAHHAHKDIALKVSEARRFIIDYLSKERIYNVQGWIATSGTNFTTIDPVSPWPSAQLPYYLRNILEICDPKDPSEIRGVIKDLLCDRRTLSQVKPKSASKNLWDYFLCAQIKDEDLPWAVDQVEW